MQDKNVHSCKTGNRFETTKRVKEETLSELKKTRCYVNLFSVETEPTSGSPYLPKHSTTRNTNSQKEKLQTIKDGEDREREIR